MNPKIYLAILLMMLPVATAAETPVTDEAILREIKEVLWPRAYAEQDVELLDAILADEFQMVDSEGNWTTKKDELAWIQTNAPSYEDFEFQIKRLEIFPNGSAIVAGQGVIDNTDENGPYQTIYQSSNVLLKRDGKWRAVASHVSGVKRVSGDDD